jgi:hypothetical protein
MLLVTLERSFMGLRGSPSCDTSVFSPAIGYCNLTKTISRNHRKLEYQLVEPRKILQ